MDQIVWDSSLASEFTDLLLKLKHMLLDQETALRNEMRKLMLSTLKEDRAISSLLEQLKHVEMLLVSLEEDSDTFRGGIYRAVELFESTERSIAKSFSKCLPNDQIGRSRGRNARIPAQNNGVVIVNSPHSIIAEDWLSDLASK